MWPSTARTVFTSFRPVFSASHTAFAKSPISATRLYRRGLSEMRAARYYGKEDVRIEHDMPSPGANLGRRQVRVKPAFVGICGTDLHEYYGGPKFASSTPHPITKETLPVTIGHEFSGTVLEVGADISSHLKPGMRIAAQPLIFCGTCPACRSGASNVCSSGGFIGLSGFGGGLSDEIVLPADACHTLPDNVSLEVGALVEPLAVAWHAAERSNIEEIERNSDTGPVCLVIGAGPIGLAAIQILAARGASKILVSEVSTKRQEFARHLGADHVMDPKEVDVIKMSKKLCDGTGPDLVFDCAGLRQSLETACRAVRVRGTIVNVAVWEGPVPFDPNWLVFNEASYTAVLGYDKKDWEGVISALRDGKLKHAEAMITAKVKLEDLVTGGYETLHGPQRDQHIKILVDMDTGR